MSALFTGIKFGLALTFLIGPVFLSLLQTSLEGGYKKGFLMALGISLSDTIFVLLCFLGLVQFVSSEALKKPTGYTGGLILILFGLYHLAIKTGRQSKNNRQIQTIVAQHWYNYIIKGFLINSFNPAVPLFWIGTISYVTIDIGYTASDFYIFFAAMLFTILTTDFLKAMLAHQVRRLITPSFLKVINVTLGIVLILAGGRLIWYA